MGQQIYTAYTEAITSTTKTDENPQTENKTKISIQDDINFYASRNVSNEGIIDSNNNQPLLTDGIEYVKRIRQSLNELAKLESWTDINEKLEKLIQEDLLTHIQNEYSNSKNANDNSKTEREQIQSMMERKLNENSRETWSAFSQSFDADETERKSQLSHFGVQSLVSILLLLIRSVEKHDATLIQQILDLALYLSQQLPINSLGPSSVAPNLLDSFQPLVNYINELTLQSDQTKANQAQIILLSFAFAKGSFKELLPIINTLAFKKTDKYNVTGFGKQLNTALNALIKRNSIDTDDDSLISLEYLKSINSYSPDEISVQPTGFITGQELSSIILAHIDLHHQPDLSSPNSVSFELQPTTLTQLFSMIEKITEDISTTRTKTEDQILFVCSKLFTNHLEFLSIASIQSNSDESSTFDMTRYVSFEEIDRWLAVIFKLATDETSETKNIKKIASKAVAYILKIRSRTFTEKLSVLWDYIKESKYPLVVEHFLVEMKTDEFLTNWFNLLLSENKNPNSISLGILKSLVDIYFDPASENHLNRIEEVLSKFQTIVICELLAHAGKKEIGSTTPKPTYDADKSKSIGSLVIYYAKYMFKSLSQTELTNKGVLRDFIVGIFLITQVNDIMHHESIEPILIALLPLLADYFSKIPLDITENQQVEKKLISWLIGRISYALIVGLPVDTLETKHHQKSKSSLFIGGCSSSTVDEQEDFIDIYQSNLASYSDYHLSVNSRESSDDRDFLLSIFYNKDRGAQLFDKLKETLKSKFNFPMKSIEKPATTACAQIFAVYIKHYRRINLARSELNRSQQNRPHPQLKSIFEYSTRVLTLMATVKAQGADLDAFCQQIEERTKFLLLSVSESPFIPIVELNDWKPATIIESTGNRGIKFNRQVSRWSKAKHVLKLLRHTFQACLRFKQFMLEKKSTIQEIYDLETMTNKTIEQFLYGEISKTNTNQQNENKLMDINEFKSCLIRQNHRALVRLLTLRFIQVFVEKSLKSSEDTQFIQVYLPFMRKYDNNWTNFEHIEASNISIKQKISDTYYSIIQSLLVPNRIPIEIHLSLINLNYDTLDFSSLIQYEYMQNLFSKHIHADCRPVVIESNFGAFQWFRSFTFQLCGQVELEQRQHTTTCAAFQKHQKILFDQLVLNELKALYQLYQSLDHTEEKDNINSLKDLATKWFLLSDEKKQAEKLTKNNLGLFINQYLCLILRCLYTYPSVVSCFSTVDSVQVILNIYQSVSSNIMQILALKILRHLICSLPVQGNNGSRMLIETFLRRSLLSIGESYRNNQNNLGTVSQLIYFYRHAMNINSDCQSIAIDFAINAIRSHLNLKSIQSNDPEQMDLLIGALSIFGGYVEPLYVGGLVRISSETESSEDYQLGIILDFDDSSSNTDKPWHVQLLQTNQCDSFSETRLTAEVDVPPPNLDVSSPHTESVLDTLGVFIELSNDQNDSIEILRMRRRAISLLYHLLKRKDIVELFMTKPYVNQLARYSLCDTSNNTLKLPLDLQVFNKTHCEQYLLSLEQYNPNEQLEENSNIETGDKDQQTKANQSIRDAITFSKYSGWKPAMTQIEYNMFSQGLLTDGQFTISSVPRSVVQRSAFRECGNEHKFNGRIVPTYANSSSSFPTFVVDGLQVTEGKWYFCVRLVTGGVVQIGWITHGFAPGGSSGVGDDKYSWSYDGSRAVFFNDQGFYGQYSDHLWTENDICGCGIEIDGNQTNIKYWLNGELLGTAFRHKTSIGGTSTKCDMFPNGPSTSYSPALTIQRSSDSSKTCELIFHPDDMTDCPLPYGYKPFFMPKIIPDKISLVPYPAHAYLVSNCVDYFLLRRKSSDTESTLRDFIGHNPVQTNMSIEDGYLKMTEQSPGLPLMIETHDLQAFTISFCFQFNTIEQNECVLGAIGTSESFTIPWKSEASDQRYHAVITFNLKENNLQIYIDSIERTFNFNFKNETSEKLSLNILPKTNGKMKNLAIWKHKLDHEELIRFFTYGIDYVGSDYKKFREHELQANILSFSADQTEFVDDSILLFNEPFTDELWKAKQLTADPDETKYFEKNENGNFSSIKLTNNTHLIMKKSERIWSEYSIALDLLVARYPSEQSQSKIICLNSSTSIYLNSDGKLCSQLDDQTHVGQSTVPLNEYIRLTISVQDRSFQMFFNGHLENETTISDDNKLFISSDHVDLFRDACTNDDNDGERTTRFLLKSISYCNKALPTTAINNISKSVDVSMKQYVKPRLELFLSTLMLMNCEPSWIKSVVEGRSINNISNVFEILYKEKENFIQQDLNTKKDRYFKILSRFEPNSEEQYIQQLLNISMLQSKQDLDTISDRLYEYWVNRTGTEQNASNSIQRKPISNNQGDVADWFSRSVQDLGIKRSLSEWISDQNTQTVESDHTYELMDPNNSQQDVMLVDCLQKNLTKIPKYSHKQLSSEQLSKNKEQCENGLITIYSRLIIANMLKIWSSDDNIRFPLELVADHSTNIKLMKILNQMQTEQNENKNYIFYLLFIIIRNELKQLFNTPSKESVFNVEQRKKLTPFFYNIQHEIINQTIGYLCRASTAENQTEALLDDERYGLFFVFRCLSLFVKLINDPDLGQSCSVNNLMQVIFPEVLINLIFNVHMMIPILHEKCFILYQFTNLIQTTHQSILNRYQEEFFTRLLAELSSNTIQLKTCSQKRFKLAVTDLIYALRSVKVQDLGLKTMDDKQKNSFVSKLSSLPENVRDLFLTMDAASAVHQLAKQKEIAEQLLDYVKKKGIKNLTLNKQNFDEISKVFTVNSDQELIRFMNTDPNILDLFSNFLAKLPTGSEANENFYKNYPKLLSISADTIRLRSEYLYIFNIMIQNTLNMIDLTLSPGKSYISDQIRTMKMYFLCATKLQLFNCSLEKTSGDYSSDWLPIEFDVIRANSENENTFFHQAFQQLHANAHEIFRRSNDQLWRAQYVGMHSTDQGGPYRDSITRICGDICSTRLQLFILCPNGRTNTGSNRDCWIPNVFSPHRPIPKKLKKQYRFVGQLLGMAIRKKHYLDIKFAPLVWKGLLGDKITVEDIESIDQQSFTVIYELEKNIEQIISLGKNENVDFLFSTILDDIRFDVISSGSQTFELISGGSDIPITMSNFKHYCAKYRSYRLEEFDRQIECIRQGLYSVVPCYYLTLFTATELEEAVCGAGRIDVDLLKRNTSYGSDFNENTPHIQRFWTVFSDMFSDEQKKLFLTFVWGRSTLPCRDEDFQSKFQINAYDLYESGQNIDRVLARSHTCFFTVDLPEYSTTEIMYERLNYAISSCSSIDGDGLINEASDSREEDESDEDSDDEYD